jgi:hypothetical protein
MSKGVYEHKSWDCYKNSKVRRKKLKERMIGNKYSVGNICWTRGLTKESSEKFRLSVEKGRETQKGRHYSPETEFKKGSIPPYKGKRLPLRMRKKISMTLTGDSEWKGFHANERIRIQGTPQYKKWRTSVFERDNYTCQICGKKGKYLNAHHKKLFSKYKNLRFNINNGITICRKCHYALHRGKRE